MRSVHRLPGHHAAIHRTVLLLLALAWVSLASSCHRNDPTGTEFRGAAAKGDITKVRALLKAHPDLILSKNKNGATALHWAAA
jgi:ankyrin repeat protein